MMMMLTNNAHKAYLYRLSAGPGAVAMHFNYQT